MRKVGIIGGLGPETTAKFYLEILSRCSEKDKEQRPPILIWNVPVPFKIEEDLVVRAKGEERFLPFLIEGAQTLEKGGAEFLVMPCNSLDVFIGKIRKSVNIPVLSIVEETCTFLRNNRIKNIGILATPSSLKSGLHKNHFLKCNIKAIVPEEKSKDLIGKIIFRILSNSSKEEDFLMLNEIIDKFKMEGIDDVLLACTDLQLLIQKHDKLTIHDTMKILAKRTAEKILR